MAYEIIMLLNHLFAFPSLGQSAGGSLDHNIELQTVFQTLLPVTIHLNKKTGNIPPCYEHVHCPSLYEIPTEVVRNQQNRYMQSSLLTADGTNASVYRAAELSRPMGFVSREKKNPSKQKVLRVFTLQYGQGKKSHAGTQTSFPTTC